MAEVGAFSVAHLIGGVTLACGLLAGCLQLGDSCLYPNNLCPGLPSLQLDQRDPDRRSRPTVQVHRCAVRALGQLLDRQHEAGRETL